MPRRGATPKPPGRQQDRRSRNLVPLEGGLSSVPEPPKGLLVSTKKAWDTYWTSEVAKAAAEVDLPAIERLFTYYDEWTRCMTAYRKERIVKGSTRQPRLSPYADQVDRVEKAIGRLEADLGLTPLARLRLGVAIGQAHKTIEDLNRAADANEDEGRETEDPRLTAVVIASQDE